MKQINILFLALLTTSIIHTFDRLTILTGPLGGDSAGHPAVMRSLLTGLAQANIPFNYNPSKLDDVGDAVAVIADTLALKQAIGWKRSGRIKTLVGGPNLVVLPTEANSIIKSPELQMFFSPSQWPMDFWREVDPSIRINIGIWPAGVDEKFWQPSNPDKADSKTVLVYCKAQSDGPNFYAQVEQHLRTYGWNPIRITYGSYGQQQYKDILDQCRFAVFLSRSESQGLALAECWAMNVPTLVWNPGSALIAGRTYNGVSAAPHLTTFTGQFWKNFDELDTLVRQLNSWYPQCTPRNWVLENMTDTVSTQIFLNLINKVEHR
jgi:hypothetical protein